MFLAKDVGRVEGGALRGREGSPYGLLTERYAICECMHASVSVYV